MQFIRRDPQKAYLSRHLEVPKHLINVDAVKSGLTFVHKTHTGKEEVFYLYKEAKHHLLMPRAFWDPGVLPCPTVDVRPRAYATFDFKSKVRLDHRMADIGNGQKALRPTGFDNQLRAVTALEGAQGGILQLGCGQGKSVCALELIARSRVPAIIVVDNTNLLEQWKDEIEQFLDVPGGVGLIGKGVFDWQKGVVLATYQSLASKAKTFPEEVSRWFGTSIWDEHHHTSAPSYSQSADLFYGRRYGLTATPTRSDGMHVVSEYHVGPVLYKNLRQALKPRLVFSWTGIALELTNPAVARQVHDSTGSVHLSKVASYFAGYRGHLNNVIHDTVLAKEVGRKTLVLTNSVAEAVNLMAIWTRGSDTPLYSDLPMPTPEDFGETTALFLSPKEEEVLKKNITHMWKNVDRPRRGFEQDANILMVQWAHHLTGKRILAKYAASQRAYVKALIKEPSYAGLMTYEVPPPMRQQFLAERPVIFAITKYGKEGLDCQELDTVLVSSLFSDRNGLQQLMGRPTRPMPGKKSPLVVFYVHTVGEIVGMSRTLQKHLRSWPVDEGGPFAFELVNWPNTTSKLNSVADALKTP